LSTIVDVMIATVHYKIALTGRARCLRAGIVTPASGDMYCAGCGQAALPVRRAKVRLGQQ
jgi:hypothetical protein